MLGKSRGVTQKSWQNETLEKERVWKNWVETMMSSRKMKRARDPDTKVKKKDERILKLVKKNGNGKKKISWLTQVRASERKANTVKKITKQMGQTGHIRQRSRKPHWNEESCIIFFSLRDMGGVKCYPVAAQNAWGNQEPADACRSWIFLLLWPITVWDGTT